jgi:hypothetical protein
MPVLKLNKAAISSITDNNEYRKKAKITEPRDIVIIE